MPISATEFDYVRDLVRRESAIVLDRDKEYLVESRLTGMARGEGYDSLGEFLRFLRDLGGSPAAGLRRRVVEAMTTNETSFFRDVHPFEAFRRVIVPDLLARRAARRELTIWCGAASSGQEPYTIAMLLREMAGWLDGWRVQILATDLSNEMLERAREGRFNQIEVNRGLPVELLVKYFYRDGLDWRIRDDLRAMIEFRYLNLAEPWPALPPADVVFLRNVLIYFDVPTKKEVLGRVRRVLRPDGYLFLGGAETTLSLDDAFQRRQEGRAAFYRLAGA